MSNSVLDPEDLPTLEYIVTHVFCPLQLPDGDDHSVINDRSLTAAIAAVAHLYTVHNRSNAPEWHGISRMLENLQDVVQFQSLDSSQTTSQLCDMNVGDVLAFLIRAQNAAVVFRKRADVTLFESFEVSPKTEDVMAAQGKLVCSYPGPAIEVPNHIFDNKNFISELANFLFHMNDDIILDAAATTQRAQSTVLETRDTTDPRYIAGLLTGILRGVGRPADIVRIRKRIGDDVVWNNSGLPWRRSPLWLLIRVVLQTTLDRSTPGRVAYKEFMLFFMCCLAKERICADLSNDLLQFMSAKISRRLRKLGSAASDRLSRIVLETCTSLRSTLEKRWSRIQAVQRISPYWNPSELDLSRDIQLSLSNSSNYLRKCLANHVTDPGNTNFSPGHRRRGDLDDFLSSDGAFFGKAYRAEPHVSLYDVERAVREKIDDWVYTVTENDGACVQLEILANKYSLGALKTYEKNPELLSVMLLTMIELWVALDKIAIKDIPMLAEYSPEVPISILEDLLVCKAASFDRLRHIHQYLSRRHSHSYRGSVFSDTVTADTFAVRYYRGSSRLQSLKSRIEDEARIEVRDKIAELEKANARYAELQREVDRIEHTYGTNWRGRMYHCRHCSKCDLENQQRRMVIALHEWPLPAQQLQAEVVVFELNCPVSFNMWRTATFRLLVDLCSPSQVPHEPYIKLHKYDSLQPYLVSHTRSRISLASDAKPFVVSHYQTTPIPTTEEAVCVSNGLKFYGYDSHARVLTSEALGRFSIRKHCTYQIQSGPYGGPARVEGPDDGMAASCSTCAATLPSPHSHAPNPDSGSSGSTLCLHRHNGNLQKYINTTLHTSNQVIANQVDCHADLSLHEYLAFGHLRSGGALQWLNILHGLRGRSLSFRRYEVHFLMTQAVSQVGPPASTGWAWHQDLQQPSFCCALLGELETLLRDIGGNWQEGVTMDTVSFLLRRLLSSDPDQAVSLRALDLLRAVRGKVFTWVEELSAKLTETPGDELLGGFLRDSAAICRSTFDVDSDLIHSVFSSAEDVDILLSSAILIHNHTPSKVSCLSVYSQLLLDRDHRLSLALEDILRDLIQTDFGDEGIDRAIRRIWHDYRPGSEWTPLHNPDSRWVSCTTASTADQRSQRAYLNLLDGSLLVDGKPLGRLPAEILRHPLYNLIFGEQVLDIIPGDIPGMDYSTRGKISSHQVYFSLRNDSDLVIKAKRKQATHDKPEFVVLIPQGMMQGDLPAVLVEGHAHWLNLSTFVLEICPLDTIWKTSPENWKIDCIPGNYRMHRGDELLIDIRSSSWAMVSDLLKPLDTAQNLLISVLPIDSGSQSLQLSVALPRYGLSFHVDGDGELQSRNIRGMVYDKNQCIGTMFGLVNRLVLRPKVKDVNIIELIPRCIIIPEGKVSFRKSSHHVCVEVSTPRSALCRITYQTYRVDTDLGCLATVGLTNKLYCAYLHALTGGCSIDPLTGRSGTEEALSLLWSASCWSVVKFNSDDAKLLGLIASICPSRTWYPGHLKCMQKVQWLDLPVNSQHHELYVVTSAIKAHYKRLQSFHENTPNQSFQAFPSQEDHLLERSARRAAYLFPSDSSWKPSSTKRGDIRYTSRDLMENDPGEHRAYTAATTVHNRTANATITKDTLNMVESWADEVSGNATLSLQYDKPWLAPDLPSIWLEAYNLLRRSGKEKWFQLLFTLPAMTYASPELSDLVPVLVAFASQPHAFENPPCYNSYTLSDKYYPSRATLRSHVSDSAHFFDCSPESSETARHNEDSSDLRQRQGRMYEARIDLDAETTVDELLMAWPCETPPECSLSHSLYDVETLTSGVRAHFASCYRNLKLKEHLTRVQKTLRNIQVSPTPTPQYTFDPSQTTSSCVSWTFTAKQLFSRPEPSLPEHDTFPRSAADVGNTSFSGAAMLHQLIATAEANATNLCQRRYVTALRASAKRFESEVSLVSFGATDLPDAEALMTYYDLCRATYADSVRYLQQHLGPRSRDERALQRSGQWPRMTPRALLGFLASNSPMTLSDDWKACVIRLALLVLQVQRSRRLLRLRLDNHHEELLRELQNEGCDGWNAEMHPDWLLIQLQGNFFVRRVQTEVAQEMISPHFGDNTAMQLNMGEGKSSVIVPIVVAVLADGEQLVRVIVPKALTAQMFHLLVDRLSGLTNRRVYFVPFSRSLQVDRQKATALHEIMEECMKERGVLVVQPEHILSLKLVSVEKQLPDVDDTEVGPSLLELQRWLHSHSRDILDESDEILHVRYQLVYTIGFQQSMEGFPERWTTTQQILGLVKKHAAFLWELFPLGVEYECGGSGSFPHLRILHADAGQRLVTCILNDTINDHLPNFSFAKIRSDLKDAIRSFISCEDVPAEKVHLVREYAQESSLWGGLLLLRGLLATGILLFAFRERRWRVDYGLALDRTMLAVPYRAKDVPAQRAEFGHPDVAIILTCLSYYYRGLNEKQLELSFEILLQQDDPSVDYDLWVREGSSIPDELKTLNGINIKSSEQWGKHLIPLFSRNKATIDFYLSRVVFPREAKEFPEKLSCSGWDLAERRGRLVTGFSGTNDGRYLLPLHITQRDPDHQRGTNAKVLSYLLRPENGNYMCMTHENGERRTTKEFLKILVDEKPDIRVLLDVGAQMLELQNDELAQAWLDVSSDAAAAIYFNEDDELTVLARDGHTQLLLSSPFAQQLDQCVVYLDDAHTRGTDIKFPSGFRAAITLGPKVTKDRLTQGCMRMRKLGHAHSIMFFAPLEIDRHIRSVAAKGPQDAIDTMDILHWAMHETCDEIQQRAHHWVQQGTDHASRYAAWSGFCEDQLTSKDLSDRWLQPEAKSLGDLYGPHNTSQPSIPSGIRQRCEELGILSLRNVSMDEEQEREVIHEVERERQVERPPGAPPANHSIHHDVIAFVKTGVIPTNSKAFRPAFMSLEGTSAESHEAHVWNPLMLVTMDFQKTVKSSRKVDEYLRPVQWIVSGKMGNNDVLIILSPHEANLLIPDIRSSNKVHLHLYTPRVTRSMKPCDDLLLYSIPTVPTGWIAPSFLMDQLNVFAGQLYLKDYATYIRLCRFLCVYARDLESEEGIKVGCDGFIEMRDRPKRLQDIHTFQSSPLLSLRALMALRRKGMSFTQTHMGRLLDGRLLSEDDFDSSHDVVIEDD